MLTPQFQLDIRQELIVDLFAGGGGMSSAIEHATGLHPDIACNHDADAISMHEANHPQTEHFQADVYELCPKAATQGRPVGLLHLSPDCTHHSQAAGGQPRNKATRSLSWVGKRWAGQAKPRVITLENVKEIQKWGPLVAKRCKKTGRVLKLDGSVAAPGEVVPVNNQHLIPNPKKQGQTWKRFVHCLRELGYQVEWRLLIAADFGAPTTRERLFMVARRDFRKAMTYLHLKTGQINKGARDYDRHTKSQQATTTPPAPALPDLQAACLTEREQQALSALIRHFKELNVLVYNLQQPLKQIGYPHSADLFDHRQIANSQCTMLKRFA